MIPANTTSSGRIPIATYRIQFNRGFTFLDARRAVEYLHTLGISDCYASSYLKAVPGSTHGYDVADPTQLNPELGSEAEYWEWIRALQDRGMGHILDLVPNHMGIAASANPWWNDVLENGRSSRYARFFDIEWQPVKDELANKVLLPILGDQYGAVLERQELTLLYADGAFVIRYFDHTLPIAPDTFGRLLEADLESWLADHSSRIDGADADELRSIITAADNLPPRTSRDSDAIGLRAREKEVIKRRLAAVLDRSALRDFVDVRLRVFNGTPGEPGSFDALDQLLNAQSYRLAHWRVASEEINYRRFFDINQLAALRMEDPIVFDEVHRFVFELVDRGAATGFRVDHVDGLFAPGDYLRGLQTRTGDSGFFVVVEKILMADEQLPPDWPVYGTTGYEFAAVVNNLFVDLQHERAFDEIYARFIHERRAKLSFDDIAYRCRKLVLHETMSGDINSLGHQLNRLSERNRHFRDFTLYSLISTLKEIIAGFPVYRTYMTGADGVSDADRRHLRQAISRAKRRAPGVAALVFDFIERLLLKETTVNSDEEREERRIFVGKFQQITGPVAAKGIEDTAFYIYNRLLSLNEVGANPTRFGLPPSFVHQWMQERQRSWPAGLSATATHDTKRGEDVRARLNVLSEIPAAWKAAVTEWRSLNRRYKREVNGTYAPDSNEEYFVYQTLVGAWPFEPVGQEVFRERIRTYLIKALREAKVNTSWLSPDEKYEAAVIHFADAILDPRRPFLAAFLPFQARVAELGMYNSLAQSLIKITAPGVPDFYQGTELWDLSLVDPDNRRPVDYGGRQQQLSELIRETSSPGEQAERLLHSRRDGRVKLFLIHRALAVRNNHPGLFATGDYLPLEARGAKPQCLFGFARCLGELVAVTAVPRLVATLGPGDAPPTGAALWDDTRLELPPVLRHQTFRDVFTGERLCAQETESGASLPASNLFRRFPVALLVPAE